MSAKKYSLSIIAGFLLVSGSALATTNGGASNIISVSEKLNDISLNLDHNPVKNAVILFDEGVFDSSFIKTTNGSDGAKIEKNGKVIGVCLKSSEVGGLSNHPYIPTEMKDIQFISQIFDNNAKTYKFDRKMYGKSSFKKVNEAGISKDIIIYTSKINTFQSMSRNGRAFECKSSGEAPDRKSWDKDWIGNIIAEIYFDKKDIISQNNHFVYTVDKYHETLSNFVRENLVEKNPMNFIVYPVLTENILATDVPKNYETYDPYYKRVKYIYERPVINSKFKVSSSEDERNAIGSAIGTNREKLISYINSYNGTKAIAKEYLNPSLLSSEQQHRRSYERAEEDVSQGISEYLSTSTNTELLTQASNISINADAFITPYCLWKNTTVNYNLLFQEESKNSEYPTKGVDPKYTNPFKYAKFAPGVSLNWNIYKNSIGGSSQGLKPENTALYKEARRAIDATFSNLGTNPSNYRSNNGFFTCTINEMARFNNLKGKRIEDYLKPSDIIQYFKTMFSPTANGVPVYSPMPVKIIKRMASAGSFVLEKRTNSFKRLKDYRDAKKGTMTNAKFKKIKKFYEDYYSKKDNKLVINTKTELSEYIKKYTTKIIQKMINDRISTYQSSINKLYGKSTSTNPLVKEKMASLEREQNLLKVEDVVAASRFLVETGFPADSHVLTGNNAIDKTFHIKNDILKEKLFGYNEVDEIMPFDRNYDSSFSNSKSSGGGYTKDQLWNNRTGTSILFDSGDMYLAFSSHSFGGTMSCTNYSPCPLNQTAFRKDGTPSITVIGKTAYGNLLKKTINDSFNSTEDSIFVMNSYMKGRNIVPFIGRFEIGQDSTGNKIYETKFYLIYFFKKNLDSTGSKAEIVYTIKPYGNNLEIENTDMTYGALKTSKNALVLKDVFDLDFKKDNFGNMLDFQFFNANQNGFGSENMLTESQFKNKAKYGNMNSVYYPIYGLNRKFSNVMPKSKIFGKTIYTKMRYIPNENNSDDYFESNYIPLENGKTIGPKAMGKSVQPNGSVYWGYSADEENDYSIFKFNDNGEIVNRDGMKSRSSSNDYFVAETVGTAGINSYQVGGFDTYVSRKDNTKFKYPSALYRGMFTLNPQPLNKDSKYSSSYWRNGTTDGVPFKLFRQPTFDLSFGQTNFQCSKSLYAPYEHVVEGIYDINLGVCKINGKNENASNYERVGFLCRKTEYRLPSVSINGTKCEVRYAKDLKVKEDVKCSNGTYDPIVGACVRNAVEQTIKSCEKGYVDGTKYGMYGSCIRVVENKDDSYFDPNKCSYTSEKDATFKEVENATYYNATCLNSDYSWVSNGVVEGCFKDRQKNLGIGCATMKGTLQTGNMFVVKNKEIIKDNCWGGAYIEGNNRHARLTCPSFNNIPKNVFNVAYSSGAYAGVFNNTMEYQDVAEISSQVSCPGSVNKKWPKEVLCGNDGEFDPLHGVCKSDYIINYDQCPSGKVPFYDGTIINGKEIRKCGIPECPSGFTVNGTKCVQCK